MKIRMIGLFAAISLLSSVVTPQALAYSVKNVPDFRSVAFLMTSDSMHWALPDHLSCNCLLSVSGDNGVHRNLQFDDKDSLYVGLLDDNGDVLPDGHYQYKLVAMTENYINEIREALVTQNTASLEKLRSEMIDRTDVKFGKFEVQKGQFQHCHDVRLNPES